MMRVRDGAGERVVDQWTGIDLANHEWWQRHRRPLVSLPDRIRERGARVTRRWGMPEDAWFVAMHVREGGHRAQASLPNADPRTYLPVIRRITERGGWVVRMGSPLMTPLPPMPRVVDYAHAVERVDWMDVYLWARARFFVGTQSGGSEPPKVFDTPTIRTNHSSFGHAEWSPRSFFVPKRYRLGTAVEPATLAEALASPVPWCESRVHEGLEVEVIDNDPDDLVAAVDEMFALLEDPDAPLAPQQERAQAVRAAAGAVGRMPISRSFLARHPELLA
jgi:putative glycosyltransferase (TIGR04372 family)